MSKCVLIVRIVFINDMNPFIQETHSVGFGGGDISSVALSKLERKERAYELNCHSSLLR